MANRPAHGTDREIILPAGTTFITMAMGCIVRRPGMAALLIDFADGWIVEVETANSRQGLDLMDDELQAEVARRNQAAFTANVHARENAARLAAAIDA